MPAFALTSDGASRMKNSQRVLLSAVLTGLLPMTAMLAYTSTGFSQDYPAKPIRILTTTAGGGGDFTSRQIAQGITGPLGQPVVVDNRPAIIAPEVAAKAPPDGYTLLVAGGSVWTTPLLQKAPFDAVRDFTPIALVSTAPYLLVVHPSLPVKSVRELIALAKARPGELNYAAGTAGATTHLSAELFKAMAGLNIVHIRYKGPAPSVAALVSGEVQMTINDVGLLLPYAKSGKLRVLGVTSAAPSPLAPGIPTVTSSGLPGYEAIAITGMWAPVKTPASIINRLNQEMVRALNVAEVKERFLNAGQEIVGSSPEQFASTIKSEIAKLNKLIHDAGIRTE
jgi:tripartite-type tricarboxylate transporter receptor subunit TctC